MNNTFSHHAHKEQTWDTTEVVGQEPAPRRLFRWWYALTSPPSAARRGTFVQRETQRKAHSLSSVGAFLLAVLLIFFIASLYMGTAVVFADTLAMVGTCIGLIANRMGHPRAAGTIIVLGAEIALATAILLKIPFQPADIQLYDLYALAILLVAALLPPRFIFLFAGAHTAFTIVELFIHPDTPALAQNLQPQTQLFPAILRAVGIQLLSSTVAYIWVRSATQAIERANRAEMVAELEHTISEERASSEQKKQELEASIQQLIQAQMTAMKGRITNQLPYPPAKVLWPLVGAMNLLWVRLQRAQQIEREHQRLRQAISFYSHFVQTDSHASLPVVQTGTALDQLILAAQTSRINETGGTATFSKQATVEYTQRSGRDTGKETDHSTTNHPTTSRVPYNNKHQQA